jgi:hypothetical protein
MAQQRQTRTSRQANPERWQKAVQRAIDEAIQVRQVNANGMWVATSGTHQAMAYLLEITGDVVHSCTCPAGEFGDPCCKHSARYYLDAGLLTFDGDGPEDTPPASAALIDCPFCVGGSVEEWGVAHVIVAIPCAVCAASNGAAQGALSKIRRGSETARYYLASLSLAATS